MTLPTDRLRDIAQQMGRFEASPGRAELPGARSEGGRVGGIPREAKPREAAGLSRLAAALHGGDGGVRQRSLLGPGDHGARSRSEAGSSDPREALRQSGATRTTRPTRRRSRRRQGGRPCATWRSGPRRSRRGRDLSASLGLVPRQRTTGEKPKLGRISKMGQRDLERLLVTGAMAVVRRASWSRIRRPDIRQHLAELPPTRFLTCPPGGVHTRTASASCRV